MIVPFSHPQQRRYGTFGCQCVVFLALLAGGVSDSNQAVGQPPSSADHDKSEAETRIQQLVDSLRSEHFAQRELACEQLFQIGHGALPILRASRRSSSDAEQTDRLDRIIESLAKQDLESRIHSFLKGGEAELENWSELEKWFGDSPRVRELFVDLYREHPYLVAALGGTAQQRLIGLSRVRRNLIQRGVGSRETPRRVDILALLLPMADPDFKAGAQYDFIVASLLQLYPASDFRNDVVFGDPFMRMVTRWMVGSDQSVREQVLRLALQWKMDIGLKLALETMKKTPDPVLLCRCMQTISRQGDRSHIALLASHLNDSTVVFRRRFRDIRGSDVQVGDVAAASIALLSAVPVTELGFADPAEHEIFGIIYEELVIPINKPESDEDKIAPENDGTPLPDPNPIEQAPFGPRLQQWEEMQELELQAERRAAARNAIRLKAMELVPDIPRPPAEKS